MYWISHCSGPFVIFATGSLVNPIAMGILYKSAYQESKSTQKQYVPSNVV